MCPCESQYVGILKVDTRYWILYTGYLMALSPEEGSQKADTQMEIFLQNSVLIKWF